MNQSSKLIMCVLVGLSHFAAHSLSQFRADLLARYDRDSEVFEEAVNAARECSISPILKAVEYFSRRFDDEIELGCQESLHYYICAIYLQLPAACRNLYFQQSIRIALQEQFLEAQRKRNERMRAQLLEMRKNKK